MSERVSESDRALDALREVAQRIADQSSCASEAGACYLDHKGCSVGESLSITREVLGRFEPKPCRARFIIESLADPVEDERMKCARPEGHTRRHVNATKDLEWQEGAETSILEVLRMSTHPEPPTPDRVARVAEGGGL